MLWVMGLNQYILGMGVPMDCRSLPVPLSCTHGVLCRDGTSSGALMWGDVLRLSFWLVCPPHSRVSLTLGILLVGPFLVEDWVFCGCE